MSTAKASVTASLVTAVAATAQATIPSKPNLPTSFRELYVEQRDRISVITFNRPEVRNALTRRGYNELIGALRDATFNDAITTVVLTGADGCFTAGNDLTQLRQYPNANAFFRSSNFVLGLLVKAFIYCPKLLVAVVDGPCVGIGFVLAALCDVVYCTQRAFFQAPFTQLGICAEGGATYLLPQLLGRAKASELLLFGTHMSAEDALNFNFVARIVPWAELEHQLWPQLEKYARLPVESLQATKRLLNKPVLEQLLIALQAECQELEQLRKGETYQNAIKEFMKRKEGGNYENKSKL
ncbi:enoyl-CoA delta isomerase 2-like [Anastrepha ludens]|uniref:enoyl-CoA delta isomerase 2-like n=1 Tax=Anastrepha ludens TaxID=28586 RepID=UPI0023B13C9C|nr:enoyl-CoA delta isomerase 2-like [Anastrepha ludens]